MKTTLSVLLVVAGCNMALAQNKNNLYVDVGCNTLGASVTYDRKLTRHFDLGAGVNTYRYSGVSYGDVRSAVYVDVRPYWVIKRHLLFAIADIGVAMNGGKESDSISLQRFGLYTSVGFGYCYQINKRGMGPYLSLGMNGYTENMDYKYPSRQLRALNYNAFDASLVISVGFKL